MLFSTILSVLAGSYFYRDHLFVLSSAQGDIVDTGYAKYLGNRSYTDTVAYLGIPYAEPPLGDLRFRAPRPLNKTRVSLATGGNVVDSTKYPNFCIQGTTGQGAGGAGSEDCLNVNIYAPAGAKPSSKLPVLVYIHGGGYRYGNPANWPFDHWVHQSQNVVIVSVYYRLDSFGFLAVPDFRDTTIGDFNAGFLDQTEALRWVKENIASFGGNPNEVTINGESAGGSSVELHLVAKNVETLFHRAIAQSVARVPLPTPEQQMPLFQFYASYAGCGTLTASIQTQLTCLRKASVSDLARAQDAAGNTSIFTASGYNLFLPVIDGKILVDFPTKSILAGDFIKVPLIVGATTNDTAVLGSDIAAALKSIYPSIQDAEIKALIAAYPISAFASSAALQFQTITGDVGLRCAREIMGKEFATSWAYRYNQRNPTNPSFLGVAHAAENWMMFKGTNTGVNGSTTFTQMTPTEDAFAAELIAYWLSFVRSGDPNRYKLSCSPEWPQYKGTSRIVLQQGPGTTTTVSGSFVEEEPETSKTRCALAASQVEHQQN